MSENADAAEAGHADEQTNGTAQEDEITQYEQFAALMYAKMNEEYCIKEDVEIRFSLTPSIVSRLFMYERKLVTSVDGSKKTLVDSQLFDIDVSKPEDWTALSKSKHSVRKIVYSICRNVIMSDRTAIVKGRWHSVLCLLNLLYDSIFMSQERLYPCDHFFPDTVPYRNPNHISCSYSTFTLHDFDAKFTLSRTQAYTLSVKFDLWLKKSALGPVHIRRQGKNVTRVPLPSIISTAFPEKRKELQKFERKTTTPFGIDLSELKDLFAEGSEKRNASTGQESPCRKKLATVLASEPDQAELAVEGFEEQAFHKKILFVDQIEQEVLDSTNSLYLHLADIDHVDQRTGLLENWAFWYCPYSGQLFRNSVPAVKRSITTWYPGGVLLDVPVSERAALVSKMVKKTAFKHAPLAGASMEPFTTQAYLQASVTHIVPAPQDESAEPDTDGGSSSSGSEAASNAGGSSDTEPQVQVVVNNHEINFMVTMVETNATLVVCHPASRLAWLHGLRSNGSRRVIDVTTNTVPTVADMASFHTIFLMTYNQISTWYMNRHNSFQPSSCIWHRAIFDDVHLLQNSCGVRSQVPFSTEAGIRWCFASTGHRPIDAVCSGLNCWAQLFLFTPPSMDINWFNMSSLLSRTLYAWPKRLGQGGSRVGLVKASLTPFGQEQYETVHRESDLCVSVDGEPWTVATSEAMYRSLMKKSRQTASKRLKGKQLLLSEAHNVAMRCLKGQEIGRDDVCSICFDDLEMNGTVQLMQCGHRLCIGCQTQCAKRKMLSCPYCRKKNTMRTRRLLVDEQFDSRSIYKQATDKCRLLEQIVSGTDGVTAVVIQNPATARFVKQHLSCKGRPTVQYSTLSYPAFERLQKMQKGVVVLSTRLTRHSLQLDSVKTIVFFEPTLNHGNVRSPGAIYSTNWSCDSCPKLVLYTSNTLEETAIKSGRRAVKNRERPQVVMQKQENAAFNPPVQEEEANTAFLEQLVATARANTQL